MGQVVRIFPDAGIYTPVGVMQVLTRQGCSDAGEIFVIVDQTGSYQKTSRSKPGEM